MERMSGLDASMLYTETPRAHMHTMKIALLDVSEVSGTYDRQRLVAEIERRLHLMPALRRRAVRVPFDLHHPVWVDDPDLVVAHHVRERVVPAPGGTAEFEDVLGEIHAEPLDDDRPLWEMTLISGLADGRIAVAAKIHHAVADGMASATGLMHLAASGPDDAIPPPLDDWRPESIPSSWQLVRDALVDRVKQWQLLPGLVARTGRGVARMLRARSDHEHRPPSPLSGPRAPWNGPLTRRRNVATARLRLDDFKTIKDALGCTINDVLLATTAGGLRRYAERHGGLPAKSLIVAIPTSTDAADAAPRLSGNKVSQFFTSLRTDIDDPVERVGAIHAVTKSAKILNVELGPELMEAWNEFAAPGPYQLMWRRIVPKVSTPPVNAVVSNVPGPREPLWFAGARMDGFYSLSVLNEGIALNLTVWSYLDQMYLGLVSCPERVPDLRAMMHDLEQAFDELLGCARDADRAASEPERADAG